MEPRRAPHRPCLLVSPLLVAALATLPSACAAAPTTKAGPPAARPSTARPAEEDLGSRDTRFTDTELGRALALGESDPRRGADVLAALSSRMPWIDDVLSYHAAVARSRVDAAAGRRELEAFLSKHPGSVLVPDAAAALAGLLAGDGESGAASAADRERLEALAERHGRGGEDGSPAAAATCLAAGREAAGRDGARAVGWLQCARGKAPLSSAARGAYDLVLELRRRQPSLAPDGAAALMAEARLLAREGRGKEQVATLDELLTRYPGSPSQGEAELAYGRALGRAVSKGAGGDFFEKKAASATGARRAKLLYEAATLRWNDDRNEEARALFEAMLATKSGIGDEQEALYALARIADGAGRRADAIAYFTRAAAAATGAKRAESQWRRGWVSYRAREFAAAEKAFGEMAATATRGSDTDGRADALYWQGRSREKLGRKDAARELYAAVVAEFPVGYYAAAAEQRLGRRAAPAGLREPTPPSDLPAPAATAIRRARTLREAGLVTLAARDLAARLARFDAPTRRAVLPALPSAGAYDAAFRIAIELSDKGQLPRDEARAYFYPRAHAAIVEREAAAAGIDPTLVYALMRQESAFSATAVSPAKALGLMQMLESTARRVARASGLPEPDAEALFDPAVNIALGVRYLAQLSKLFDGNTALMAAAYNAGEDAAARWKGLAAQFDEDEMIEQISYRETRGYVKAILRNMRNYRGLYDGLGTKGAATR